MEPVLPSPTASAPPAHEERRTLEHALFNAFLENIPDGVYFKDKNSRFIVVSKSKANRHGFPRPEDMIGKTDADLFSAAHARRAREDEETVIRTGIPIVGKIEKITWPDGRTSWARSSKLPLRGQQGQIIGTFGLSQDVTAAKDMEAELEKANKDVMDASRMAGMAEVATGVLHNVGNVLNSLNVSATVISSGLRQSKVDSLARVSALLREHAGHLAEFLTDDPKGRLVPDFLESLARHGAEERMRLLEEINSLQANIDHIKEIVSMQQAYATMVGIVEPLDAAMLMEDAVRMNAGALVRHNVSLVRDYQPVPAVFAERGKVLQILVNVIRNAKYALDEGRAANRTITLRVEPGAPGSVRFVVRDNGVGIPRENLVRIFNHGFTTRAHGHGFGLHSSALAAKDMHGSISVESDGLGCGAAFSLELPIADPAVVGVPAASRSEVALV